MPIATAATASAIFVVSGSLEFNAAARELGTTYGKFIAGLKASNIELDRKVLSELAVSGAKSFR